MNMMRVLDRIYDELDGMYFVLMFRGSLCVRKSVIYEWLEGIYPDAVMDAVRALGEVGYNQELRSRILSGEGDDEAFGICAYIFETSDALDDFISYCLENGMEEDVWILDKTPLDIVQYLDDECDTATFTVFEYVCKESEIKSLLK